MVLDTEWNSDLLISGVNFAIKVILIVFMMVLIFESGPAVGNCAGRVNVFILSSGAAIDNPDGR